MNIIFSLKEPKSKDTTLILMVLRFNGKKFVYSTGIKTNPVNWLTGENKCRETRDFSEGKKINAILSKMKLALANTYYSIYSPKLDIDTLKREFEKEYFQKNNDTTVEFLDFFKKVQESMKIDYGYERSKSYGTTYTHLIKFKESSDIKLLWNNINLDFYEEYVRYLRGSNYSDNYVGTHIAKIKKVMTLGAEKGLHNNFAYKKFKDIDEDVFNIYLTEEELARIYYCSGEFSKSELKTRDLFIVGCCTGLRFSDFSRLKPEHINEKGGYIDMVTKKTGARVVIPLHWMAYEIFQKYGFVLPKTPCNQVMNRNLKKIGELSEIDEPIIMVRTEGGVRKERVMKKYEMISTHTARRSFATNLYLNGAQPLNIMKITGHKTIQSFLKYIKADELQNAAMMADNPFFKKPN